LAISITQSANLEDVEHEKKNAAVVGAIAARKLGKEQHSGKGAAGGGVVIVGGADRLRALGGGKKEHG